MCAFCRPEHGCKYNPCTARKYLQLDRVAASAETWQKLLKAQKKMRHLITLARFLSFYSMRRIRLTAPHRAILKKMKINSLAFSLNGAIKMQVPTNHCSPSVAVLFVFLQQRQHLVQFNFHPVLKKQLANEMLPSSALAHLMLLKSLHR